MKNLSEFENKIIKKLLNLNEEGHLLCLANIISDQESIIFSPGYWSFDNSEEKKLKIFSVLEIPDEKLLNKKLEIVVFLFDLLKEENFIKVKNVKHNTVANIQDYELIMNDELSEKLSILWNEEFEVTENLKEYLYKIEKK